MSFWTNKEARDRSPCIGNKMVAVAIEVVYFRSLAILAICLLWGVSLWNGTVKALILAVWSGRLTDDTPLKTDYTGIYPVDFLVSLLVAFFFYGSNGHDLDYQVFLLEAYSTLQSAFVWLYVESARKQAKPRAIQRLAILITLITNDKTKCFKPYGLGSHLAGIWSCDFAAPLLCKTLELDEASKLAATECFGSFLSGYTI